MFLIDEGEKASRDDGDGTLSGDAVQSYKASLLSDLYPPFKHSIQECCHRCRELN